MRVKFHTFQINSRIMYNLSKYLFFDIETHRVNNWRDLNQDLQDAFLSYYYDEKLAVPTVEEQFNEQAALHPEFSKVICICLGYVTETFEFRSMELTNLTDEVSLLKQLAPILDQFEYNKFSLAGYNIKGFDIPYLAKRYIINGLKLPKSLNQMGKKPWEVDVLDVMELVKMGGWKAVSLKTACAALGIPCKSEEISGSNMYRYDISEIDEKELSKYCLEDVVSTYQVAKRINDYI